ncbi:MAG: ABC transporter ATP-binding protein [Candidatus Marinimicrobia bacterium]|nr:ABC transporter ATP-binding protein [Candidatus Neomarinimicrobiota bacterium]MBT4714378.1 ABC transporter ATP-binding protein [Candidatus Neomarinimicrobiota bacterium]
MNRIGLTPHNYVIHAEITLGTFYAFIAYMTGITEPIWTISWFFVSLKMAESSVDRLEEIEKFENKPVHDTVVEPPIQNLNVRDLHYRFSREAEDVINAINFQARPGEKIGVVGEVGSGKTVLLKLISGWFVPDSGSVELNEARLSELSDASRARSIGYVPQDIELFSGTVTDNISMGREAIKSLVSITQTAVIGDELDLDKMLEQGGVGLSGGQRARVALARAFYGDPPIYIFDDVTSALDLNTEKLLWRNINTDYSEALFLVATHREATAAEMDRVIWIKGGQIHHEGQHADLLRLHPEYRSLFAHD